MKPKNTVRFYNTGGPDDYIGPIDFAGRTVVISPKGKLYKRIQTQVEKRFEDEKSGTVEVRTYCQSQVANVVDDSGKPVPNDVNYVDMPPSFGNIIKHGEYATHKTPTGKLWKDILVTREQDLEAREAIIAERELAANKVLAAAQSKVEMLEAKQKALEAELAKAKKA